MPDAALELTSLLGPAAAAVVWPAELDPPAEFGVPAATVDAGARGGVAGVL